MLSFVDKAEFYECPTWIACFDNGVVAYGQTTADWHTLKQLREKYPALNMFEEEDTKLDRIELRFRSHTEVIKDENAEGYYLGQGFHGDIGLIDGHTGAMFVVGILKDGKITVQEWRVPELVPCFEPMERSLANNEHGVIFNVKNTQKQNIAV